MNIQTITHDAEIKPELSRGTVTLMAVASGLFVASIYYNQPMLGILAREFNVGASGVSTIAVMTQIGYAVGLLLLSPLGDRFERRRLITLTTMALSLSLAVAALAPGIGVMAAASLAVGVFATVAQQIVPMAAHLAKDTQRGHVVGQVMAGVLGGILLARTASGFVSEYANWRVMFGFASAATMLMGILLAIRLPRVEPTVKMSYPQILLSMAHLLRTHRTLRQAGLVQALLFGGFVAFWANLALFLEQPPLSVGSSVAGLLGIFGVVGVMAAPLAGKLIDKGGHGRIISYGAIAVTASFVLFGLFQTSWAALIAGIILMDVGLQAAMISNQYRIYALDAAARSRLNTIFMTVMFLGGALGTAISAQAFARFGWTGVCVMGTSCALLAFVFQIVNPKSEPQE